MKKAAKSVKLVVAINRKVADAEEQAVRVPGVLLTHPNFYLNPGTFGRNKIQPKCHGAFVTARVPR